MTAVTEQDVEERIELVRQQLLRHEIAITFLRKDETNLLITLETLRGFGAWTAAGSVVLPEPTEAEAANAADVAQLVADISKPAGTPTVPEMVIAIMEERALIERSGFEPKHITAEIRKRWWPEAPAASVGPIMWRMATKEGRLRKEGPLYYLPEQHVREGSLWEDGALFESSPEGEASDRSAAGPQQGPQSGITPEGGGVGAHPEAGGTC